MKALLPLFATLCLLAGALPAQPGRAPAGAPPQPKRPNLCDQPDTPSINECAARAQAAAEQQLNATYQAALKASEPEDQAKLRNVQRLWLQYREAECHVEADPNTTLRPAFFAGCVAGMDKLRTDELKHDYLD